MKRKIDLELVRRRVLGYEKGLYSRLEMLGFLVGVTALYSPEEMAPLLTNDWLLDLQKATSVPPSTPDDVIIIRPGTIRYGFSENSDDLPERTEWQRGAWAWRDYFKRTMDRQERVDKKTD